MAGLGKCTPEEVIAIADEQYQQAAKVLTKTSIQLHERGYHQWSAAVEDMKTKLERAMGELVDEIMPDTTDKSREGGPIGYE